LVAVAQDHVADIWVEVYAESDGAGTALASDSRDQLIAWIAATLIELFVR